MNQKKIEGVADSADWEELLVILEEMEDQILATYLLSQLNQKSAVWGKLFVNIDKKIPHEEWDKKCRLAKNELDRIISQIRSQKV